MRKLASRIPRSNNASRLAHEILVAIFSHLDSCEVARLKRVCKNWSIAIEQNRSLWRVLEWFQNERDSLKHALSMVHLKSKGSVERVSAKEKRMWIKSEDLLYLASMVHLWGTTLTELSITAVGVYHLQRKVPALLSLPKLRELILWDGSSSEDDLPITRLVPLNHQAPSNYANRPSDHLKVFWIYDCCQLGLQPLKSDSLKSLVSFAQRCGEGDFLSQRKLVEGLSKTIVHLKMGIGSQFLHSAPHEPVWCPNLKIFEGWTLCGFSHIIYAPHLKVMILEQVIRLILDGLPASVEEIWLRSRSPALYSEDWNFLLHSCPQLKILKLCNGFVKIKPIGSCSYFLPFFKILQTRSKMFQGGAEIRHLKIASLEKLIIPFSSFNSEQLTALKQVAANLTDTAQHSDFLELAY